MKRAFIVAAWLAAFGAPAAAQGACGVGTQIQFEDGKPGTVAEIGTASPHVGWYRVVMSWSPRGEWYPPWNWPMYVAGTRTRCGQQAAAPAPAAPPAARAQPAPTAPPVAAARPLAGAQAPAGCPFNEPPGSVSPQSRASAQLFQRVIWEREAARINPASITAPKRVGITFLAFEMGKPFENTLTANRFGDKRLHTGAPANTMLYPVRTRELQCDLHGAQTRRTVTENDRTCFISRSGTWTCPGRTTKTIESGLIPS